MGEPKSAGQLAYERYAEAVGNVNYAGEPLKQFHELSDKIKAGWEAAAPAYLNLSEREWKEIEFAQVYTESFAHGTDGHGRLVLIAKLANALRVVRFLAHERTS